MTVRLLVAAENRRSKHKINHITNFGFILQGFHGCCILVQFCASTSLLRHKLRHKNKRLGDPPYSPVPLQLSRHPLHFPLQSRAPSNGPTASKLFARRSISSQRIGKTGWQSWFSVIFSLAALFGIFAALFEFWRDYMVAVGQHRGGANERWRSAGLYDKLRGKLGERVFYLVAMACVFQAWQDQHRAARACTRYLFTDLILGRNENAPLPKNQHPYIPQLSKLPFFEYANRPGAPALVQAESSSYEHSGVRCPLTMGPQQNPRTLA